MSSMVKKTITYKEAMDQIDKELKSNYILPSMKINKKQLLRKNTNLKVSNKIDDIEEEIHLQIENTDSDIYNKSELNFKKETEISGQFERIKINCVQDSEGTDECTYSKEEKDLS